MDRLSAASTLIATFAMPVVLSGCGDRAETGAPAPSASSSPSVPIVVEFEWQSALTGDPIQIRDKGDGLIVSMYHPGDAAAPLAGAGDTVEIEFIARWIGPDGAKTEFDSSTERGAPLRVPLTKGNAVVGLLRGLEGLRAGDVARITFPAALGYGKVGRGSIPGDAGLEFVVWVRGVEPTSAAP